MLAETKNILDLNNTTERSIYYRKSELHLLMHMFHVHLIDEVHICGNIRSTLYI